MTEKNYPFTAWALTASFAPKEVELVKGGYYDVHHVTAAGKYYLDSELYPSKTDCVQAGWKKIADQQAALEKRAAAIKKKELTLTKHSLNPA